MKEHTTDSIRLNSIEEALDDIRQGKIIIVVDDEDRENEGDFIAASAHVTPDVINFMSKHGRGLICVALDADTCERLELDMMVGNNTDPHKTAFTVSVDLLGHGCTTGISAHDRSKTVQALINPAFQAKDFARPGHIFPLKAKKGGVLRRPGHTEAAVDLSAMAGLAPGGAIVEIMNDDGSMARLPQLMEIAQHFQLKIISIRDLIAYRLRSESLIQRVVERELETAYGRFTFTAYKHTLESKEYITLSRGSWTEQDEVPVRVHSGNLLSDLFHTRAQSDSSALDKALRILAAEKFGVLVYMQYIPEGLGLTDNLHVLDQEQSPSSQMDPRDYGMGAQILRDLGIRKMKLITTNPQTRRNALEGYGLEITDTIPLYS
ncbi:MAG: 3,4-dihydroxy-2-butanone-4-phosphate synthase [Flavobacteriales bacterium]